MPSYDYDGTVASIVSHRREAHSRSPPTPPPAKLEHLQKSVELFSTLSAHCPMTPLLWMEYADDAADVVRGLLLEGGEAGDGAGVGTSRADEAAKQAAETRLNILELAVSEFPGCALLRLRYLEAAVASASASSGQDGGGAAIRAAFDDALSAVGRGSHGNEDSIVAGIYRLHVQYLASSLPRAEAAGAISASYVRRAETPMRSENDSLSDEIVAAKERVDMDKVEEGRRYASRTFGSLANLEGELDVAMAEEGIMDPSRDAATVGEAVDWDNLLNGPETLEGRSRYLMGLGGARTAAAFAKYAGALSNRARKIGRKRRRDADQDDGMDGDDDAEKERELFNSLVTCVYERGVSECPTVESLWVSYVQHLFRLAAAETKAENKAGLLSQISSVCGRSVRNCPYSVRLFGLKMKSLAIAVEAGYAVFDPDKVMAIATEATEGGFLPTADAQLEVHIIALRIVRRRILSLACAPSPEEGGILAVGYDDSETMEKKKKKRKGDDGAVVEVIEYNDLDADAEQEVQDLIEDSREMYDTADLFLRKSHPSWTEGQAALWSDRGRAEAYVYSPLLQSLEDEQSNGAKASDEVVRCFEKSVRLHQPPHPDLWVTYIHYIRGRCRNLGGVSDTAGATAAKFRKVRGLFHRAMASVKKQKTNEDVNANQTVLSFRDYDMALYNLCHEYLEFERMFGSEESYGHAAKAVKGKLRQLGEGATASVHQLQGGQNISGEVEAMEVKDSRGGVGASNDLASSDTEKRKREDEKVAADDDATAPAQKRLKGETQEEKSNEAQQPEQRDDQTGKKTNLKIVKRHPEHKVRINNLDYPAHPFTVRVSNLSHDTEDMDLVDTFGPKCGTIVHARILREKHQHPRNDKAKSKGSGLIQFEERESVDKALELDGVLGLQNKLIKVERSHIPAAGIVPPGMHRVKPKGEGRCTKRNQKRRAAVAGNADSSEKGKNGEKKQEELSSNAKARSPNVGQTSVLSFRPRGLHGQKHHKVKIDLGGKK